MIATSPLGVVVEGINKLHRAPPVALQQAAHPRVRELGLHNGNVPTRSRILLEHDFAKYVTDSIHCRFYLYTYMMILLWYSMELSPIRYNSTVVLYLWQYTKHSWMKAHMVSFASALRNHCSFYRDRSAGYVLNNNIDQKWHLNLDLSWI